MSQTATKPGVRIRLCLVPLAIVLLTSACQSTMSVEEAKKVTTAFAGAAFVPPPRTINDITAILAQQERASPELAAQARAKADQSPPQTTDPGTLATFYYERGLAAGEIGRARQEIEDLTQALQWAQRGAGIAYHEVAWRLGRAEVRGGNFSRAEAYLRQAMAATPPDRRGWLISVHATLVGLYVNAGDLAAAEAETRRLLNLLIESRSWRSVRSEQVAFMNAFAADAQAFLAQAKGRYAEAEVFFREAIDWLAGDAVTSKDPVIDLLHSRLATALARQGRLLEAENEARTGLLGALSKRGRYSTHTALIMLRLIDVIAEQGRFSEAETLARAAVDIYQKTGTAEDSTSLAFVRDRLGAALVAQERWQEALAEYEAIRRGMTSDPEGYQKYVAGNVNFALALLNTGQPDLALQELKTALQRSQRLGSPGLPELRGLLAMAQAAKGDRERALAEFARAVPTLLRPSEEVDDETATRSARDHRLSLILTAYIGLLADIAGTPLERQAGLAAAAEAFRLADVARGRSVQRALDASAARAAAKTSALADLVRREQDARKQISALHALLASALSQPTDQQKPTVLAGLRGPVEALGRARRALAEQIEKQFPAYAELINPKPATVEHVRASLRPGESLIATFVTPGRVFVWAVPHTGPMAFAAAPVGAKAIQEAVATLREALAPSAKTLGDIPEFELGLAHRLYTTLLEPVRSGWGDARSLLVVSHGPLGQLPFALLPTKLARLGPEEALLFANYRAVPWLIRAHSVTVLPSVGALLTLRGVPPGDPARRPFVGFGDPYFNPEQARRRARAGGPAEVAALAIRNVPLAVRALPRTQQLDTSQLAMLPRLPDTADEIKSIAQAMGADPTRDVFLGERANEQVVKTLDLSRYRVIAFATHGLVPGDLDGLTQPALALSAPEVAEVEGDGLLTMEEILALRLNADWVVLSACNTASGQGAGGEAVSGLGRAFFYAGARALLVSNWPVETTSARELTTELFRRQAADPGVSRAQALQQTMNWLIDAGAFRDARTSRIVSSYAHPIFWAPFTLVGDGGAN